MKMTSTSEYESMLVLWIIIPFEENEKKTSMANIKLYIQLRAPWIIYT